MLNRKIHPEFKQIKNINIPKFETYKLDNQIPVYILRGGSQEVINIDFVFEAGYYYQPSLLVATSANAMLNEGTKTLKAAQIAEKVEFYGSYLHVDANTHDASVNLFTLCKYLPQTLSVLQDIIKNSIFPEEEFNVYIQKRKQNFQIEMTKVESQASHKFSDVLWGNQHPYGIAAKAEDFDQVNTAQLRDFYADRYKSNNCKIFVAGQVTDEHLKMLNAQFGGDDWKSKSELPELVEYPVISNPELQHLIHHPDAMQAAIRMGKKLINRAHPDYLGLQVLNTVFGGYFGSRLMANVRENKGYTYGISSHNASLRRGGYLIISTNVGVEVWKDAVKEILFETRKLREELIPDQELTLVRNYMMGDMLNAFNGVFEVTGLYKRNIQYDQDETYYQKYIDVVNNITAQELNDLANRYYGENDLYTVVAGKLD